MSKMSDLQWKKTRRARGSAHKAFDQLWLTGLYSREDAYAILARRLGLTSVECHFAHMDEATAKRAHKAARKLFRERHEANKRRGTGRARGKLNNERRERDARTPTISE